MAKLGTVCLRGLTTFVLIRQEIINLIDAEALSYQGMETYYGAK